MTGPRYALYPGWVKSSTDGEHHHVSAHALAHLYGVQVRDCLVIYDRPFRDGTEPATRVYAATLIALRPRFDGNYALPTLPESPAP